MIAYFVLQGFVFSTFLLKSIKLQGRSAILEEILKDQIFKKAEADVKRNTPSYIFKNIFRVQNVQCIFCVIIPN